MLLGNFPKMKKFFTNLMMSFLTTSHILRINLRLYPSYHGALKGSQLLMKATISTSLETQSSSIALRQGGFLKEFVGRVIWCRSTYLRWYEKWSLSFVSIKTLPLITTPSTLIILINFLLILWLTKEEIFDIVIHVAKILHSWILPK